MKVKNYEEKNGSIDIVLDNEEEQLCFWNPNIYNRGKWEIKSYIKRKHGEKIFSIITARTVKNNYHITYISDNYSRIIECSYNNIVLSDVIRPKLDKEKEDYSIDKELYFSDSPLLHTTDINQYIKQDTKYYNERSNVFDRNVSESTKAISNYLQYDKKYIEILSNMESMFKMDLEQICSNYVLSKTR